MIEIAAVDLTDAAALDAVLDLQRRAYAVEAALLGVPDLPPQRETREQLAASGESLLAARTQKGSDPFGDTRSALQSPSDEGSDPFGDVVGVVGWKAGADGTVDVHRLAVDPGAHRQGIARRLLDALPEAPRYVVATGAANAPARALYERRGFRETGRKVVAGGIEIVEYELVVSGSPTRPDRA